MLQEANRDRSYLKPDRSNNTSMQEDTFIKKFCESPLLISGISVVGQASHFYDFIGVLHILLVKNNKKKFYFSAGDLKNNLKVSKALKVPCKQIDRTFYRDKYQSNIIDESNTDEYVGESLDNNSDSHNELSSTLAINLGDADDTNEDEILDEDETDYIINGFKWDSWESRRDYWLQIKDDFFPWQRSGNTNLQFRFTF